MFTTLAIFEKLVVKPASKKHQIFNSASDSVRSRNLSRTISNSPSISLAKRRTFCVTHILRNAQGVLQQLNGFLVCVSRMRMSCSLAQCVRCARPVAGCLILDRNFFRYIGLAPSKQFAQSLCNADVSLCTATSWLPLIQNLAIELVSKSVELRLRSIWKIVMTRAVHQTRSTGQIVD